MMRIQHLLRTVPAVAALVAVLSAANVVQARGQDDPDPLVGVWESVGFAEVNCATGLPYTPGRGTDPVLLRKLRAIYTIQEGGTMAEHNTDPLEGPNRSPGAGIWRPSTNTNEAYQLKYQHYGFFDLRTLRPTRELGAVIRVEATITAAFANSFTETGTFKVFAVDRDSELASSVYEGCFADTMTRLNF